MPKNGLWMAPILAAAEAEPKRASSKSKRTSSKSASKRAPDRYVLKLNGKVVSDRKLQHRAFPWLADDLLRQGLGGGIADLLLPRSERQWRQLASDRQKYTLEAIRRRGGGRREALRVIALSHELLVQLIQICQPGPSWKKKQFVEWLVGQIKIKGSPARNLIADQAPDLLVQMRGYGWWYRLIGVKKMSR